ncbi:hypothetical protein [Oleomonas cavernae]|uniref:hypothetical protein n=1 Tax=Oleomonas cavernae TaxID=2320859 RepID=UPI0011C3FC72|nr:hypothetical protein [Oleomonas cavernae]
MLVSAAALLAVTPHPLQAAGSGGSTPLVTIAPASPADIMFSLPGFDPESDTATGRDDPTKAPPEKGRVKAGESLFVFAHDVCRRIDVQHDSPAPRSSHRLKQRASGGRSQACRRDMKKTRLPVIPRRAIPPPQRRR